METAVVKVLCVVLGFLAGAALTRAITELSRPTAIVEGPFKPRPPRPDPQPKPPAPAPAPLDDGDTRLLARLRPHFVEIARKHAAVEVQQELMQAAQALENPPTGEVDFDMIRAASGDEPMVQGAIGVMFAGAIVGVVKKLIVVVVTSLLVAALTALVVKFWFIIAPAFVFLVSLVAWPAGYAAGKLTGPKEKP